MARYVIPTTRFEEWATQFADEIGVPLDDLNLTDIADASSAAVAEIVSSADDYRVVEFEDVDASMTAYRLEDPTDILLTLRLRDRPPRTPFCQVAGLTLEARDLTGTVDLRGSDVLRAVLEACATEASVLVPGLVLLRDHMAAGQSAGVAGGAVGRAAGPGGSTPER